MRGWGGEEKAEVREGRGVPASFRENLLVLLAGIQDGLVLQACDPAIDEGLEGQAQLEVGLRKVYAGEGAGLYDWVGVLDESSDALEALGRVVCKCLCLVLVVPVCLLVLLPLNLLFAYLPSFGLLCYVPTSESEGFEGGYGESQGRRKGERV